MVPIRAERLARTLRARLEAYVALLVDRGYGPRRPRLLARARRDLGQALGYPSLRAARTALGDEALVRAAEVLDGWTADLADPDPFAPDAPPADVTTGRPRAP